MTPDTTTYTEQVYDNDEEYPVKISNHVSDNCGDIAMVPNTSKQSQITATISSDTNDTDASLMSETSIRLAEAIESEIDCLSMQNPLTAATNADTMTDARKQKRFTLTLPIHANFDTLEQTRPASPTRSHTTSTTISSDEATQGSSLSDTHFLTAIASQERRVLELREELIKAEQNLHKLKRDWAQHEVYKKRQDIRRQRGLRYSNTGDITVPSTSVENTQRTEGVAREIERRRALQQLSRPTHRKVFSSSKHTRTLSLLSPDLPTTTTTPDTTPSLSTIAVSKPASDIQPPHDCPLDSTAKSQKVTSQAETFQISHVDAQDTEMPREVLMRAGRQMALDLKDGLWTFLEDLRQVTVGDENMPPNDTRPSKSNDLFSSLHPTSPPKSRLSKPPSSRAPDTLRKQLSHISKGDKRVNGRPNLSNITKTDSVPNHVHKCHTKHNSLIDIEEPVEDVARTPRIYSKLANNSHLVRSPRIADENESWDTWDSPATEKDAQINLDGLDRKDEAVAFTQKYVA